MLNRVVPSNGTNRAVVRLMNQNLYPQHGDGTHFHRLRRYRNLTMSRDAFFTAGSFIQDLRRSIILSAQRRYNLQGFTAFMNRNFDPVSGIATRRPVGGLHRDNISDNRLRLMKNNFITRGFIYVKSQFYGFGDDMSRNIHMVAVDKRLDDATCRAVSCTCQDKTSQRSGPDLRCKHMRLFDLWIPENYNTLRLPRIRSRRGVPSLRL